MYNIQCYPVMLATNFSLRHFDPALFVPIMHCFMCPHFVYLLSTWSIVMHSIQYNPEVRHELEIRKRVAENLRQIALSSHHHVEYDDDSKSLAEEEEGRRRKKKHRKQEVVEEEEEQEGKKHRKKKT